MANKVVWRVELDGKLLHVGPIRSCEVVYRAVKVALIIVDSLDGHALNLIKELR